MDYPHEELPGWELWEIGLLKDEEASREPFRASIFKAQESLRRKNI
jgi:hypothetical protein